IIELAHERGDPPLAVAAVYFALEARLRVDRLAQRIVSLPHRDRWTAAARSALRDALADAQRNLSIDVLATTDAHLGPDERGAAAVGPERGSGWAPVRRSGRRPPRPAGGRALPSCAAVGASRHGAGRDLRPTGSRPPRAARATRCAADRRS